jgi:polysaccharide export outer membrane protein
VHPQLAQARAMEMSMPDRSGRMSGTAMARLRARALALIALASLAGCAGLPNSAPTARQVQKSVAAADIGGVPYRLVDIDPAVAIEPPRENRLPTLQLEALGGAGEPARTDLIRPGDTLTIQIFEVGVSLFNSGAPSAVSADAGPTANAQRIVVSVRDDGTINLPYVGVVHAEGTYPEMLASTIRRRLRQYSQSPEALVTITDTVENAAYVLGLVGKSGRYRLTSAREKLLDVLALAGGVTADPSDIELRVVRGDRTATVPLVDLRNEDLANITVLPGDRIQVLRRRKSYTVFGATDRVSQVNFEAQNLTLAEAVARVGGPSDARADAKAVFLFRFEPTGPGGKPQPVIYRLNLLLPQSYFAAQMFRMQDKDVLLFSNAGLNMTTKFLNVLNQLFSPFITVRAAATNNN